MLFNGRFSYELTLFKNIKLEFKKSIFVGRCLVGMFLVLQTVSDLAWLDNNFSTLQGWKHNIYLIENILQILNVDLFQG